MPNDKTQGAFNRTPIYLVGFACFLVIFYVSCLVTRALHDRMIASASLRFDKYALQLSNSVEGKLTRYVDLLPGLRALWAVNDGVVSRAEFDRYVDTLAIPQRFPSLLSLNFAEMISSAETHAYEQKVRIEEGEPQFEVRPAITPNAHRLVLRYLYPNVSLYDGRDILVNFSPKAAVYSSLVSRDGAYTSGIGTPRKDARTIALGVRLPIYKGGKAPPPALREAMYLGSVGIYIDLPLLMHESVIAGDMNTVHVSFRSLPHADDAPGGRRNLFDDGAMLDLGKSGIQSRSEQFTIAQRQFVLTITAPLAFFEDPVGPYLDAIGYGVGALLGLAGSSVLILLLLSRVQLLHKVSQQGDALNDTRSRLALAMKEQLRAEQEITQQEEHERQRIGKELHDGLGQQLTGASLLLNTLLRAEAPIPDHASTGVVGRVSQILDQAISSIRSLSRGLSPFEATQDGDELQLALMAFAADLDRVLPRGCNLHIAYDLELLTGDARLHVYRIIQEAVTNALRHAGPGFVGISIADRNGLPLIEVVDDGAGFRASMQREESLGLGLRSIRSRAHQLGLAMTLLSRDGGGTIVRVG